MLMQKALSWARRLVARRVENERVVVGMVLPIALLVGAPAVGGSAYYLWLAGRQAQLRAMGLAEEITTSSFGSTIVGLASVAGSYMCVMTVASPLVDGGGTMTAGGAQKIESVGQFSKMAGPPMVARASALCLGMYVGGRVQAWMACRGDVKAPARSAKR